MHCLKGCAALTFLSGLKNGMPEMVICSSEQAGEGRGVAGVPQLVMPAVTCYGRPSLSTANPMRGTLHLSSDRPKHAFEDSPPTLQ